MAGVILAIRKNGYRKPATKNLKLPDRQHTNTPVGERMPKRLVDGDAISTSQRILSVQPESFRIHYPYWLTLAEGNGAFEANCLSIWKSLYAVIMPSVTVQTVEKILQEFIRAGLVVLFEYEGKTFGTFFGITKPGRLPSTYHQSKYSRLPIDSEQVEEIVKKSGGSSAIIRDDAPIPYPTPIPEPNPNPTAEKSKIYKKPVNLLKELPRIWAETGGIAAENPKFIKEALKSIETYDSRWVAEEFERYAKTNPSTTAKRPVQDFIRLVPALHSKKVLLRDVDTGDVEEAKLQAMRKGGPPFTNAHNAGIAEMLSTPITPKEFGMLYSAYLAQCDDWDTKRAPDKFCGGAGMSMLRLKHLEDQERAEIQAIGAAQEAELAQEAVQVRQEIAASQAAWAAEKAAEDAAFEKLLTELSEASEPAAAPSEPTEAQMPQDGPNALEDTQPEEKVRPAGGWFREHPNPACNYWTEPVGCPGCICVRPIAALLEEKACAHSPPVVE